MEAHRLLGDAREVTMTAMNDRTPNAESPDNNDDFVPGPQDPPSEADDSDDAFEDTDDEDFDDEENEEKDEPDA
jgi:hypothetical protein